jgi:hypothetical protein
VLRGQLDRPQREPGDWSVALPAGGCTCDLCAALREFLAAPDRHTLEWPLASWTSSDLLRIEVSRAGTRNWPALIPDAQKILTIFEGASEIQRMLIGRTVTGLDVREPRRGEVRRIRAAGGGSG